MRVVDYQKIIRPRILERDNFTCQECGKKVVNQRHLHVHHIKQDGQKDGYFNNNADNSDSNLITLCILCHSAKHIRRAIYDEEYLLELRRDGKKMKEIASIFGVTQQAVSRKLKVIKSRKRSYYE